MATLTQNAWLLLAASVFTMLMLWIIFSIGHWLNGGLEALAAWLKEQLNA